MKFGGGRWQILFYANSGTPSTPATGAAAANEDEEGFVSLYLSCEVSGLLPCNTHSVELTCLH